MRMLCELYELTFVTVGILAAGALGSVSGFSAAYFFILLNP